MRNFLTLGERPRSANLNAGLDRNCPLAGRSVRSGAMVSEPSESAGVTPERRPAVWPWLLMPLVALALFFALQRVKQGPQNSPAPEALSELVDSAPTAQPASY